MDESTETIEVREAGGTARLGKAVTVAGIIAVALLVIGGVLIYSALQEQAGTRLHAVYLIAALMPLGGALCAMLAVVASARRRARALLRIGEDISLPFQRTSFPAAELERMQFYSLEPGQNFLALIPRGVRVSTLDEAQQYSVRLPEQANLGPRELEEKLRERFPEVPIDHLGHVRAEG
ncbi:hypothetical protein [Corynebacterium yonathiae]|uniref:Or membrane protein n=1 Tax=Corynebacterium yonathiae TaxID=2913504 RepID=A0A9X3RM98_9CORY|nr:MULTISPECIES: hypothetical protein [Corynebacterium]MCZ9296076.1 hypothetical protein [Corynebacterium yonathiae]MDK2583272.1 hypothetical protein [Corynebacterium sp. BWA136]